MNTRGIESPSKNPVPHIDEAFVRARWPLIAGIGLVLLGGTLSYFELNLERLNEHWAWLPGWASHLVSELGYAFMIAFVVAWAIEAKASASHVQALERARDHAEASMDAHRAKLDDEVTKHLAQMRSVETAGLRAVFEWAFAAKHDTRYVKTALLNCFDHRLIRENYFVKYVIEPFPDDAANAAGIDSSSFVLLTATIQYYVRNIGVRTEQVATSYGIPIREGALRAFSKVLHFEVGKVFTQPEIDKIATEDGEALERDYEVAHDLAPGEGVHVKIVARMVKDRNDSDTFGFRYPTLGVRCVLTSKIPNMRIGAHARTASAMKQSDYLSDQDTREWEIAGSVLPYNSIVFWWQKDAEARRQGESKALEEPKN